MRLTVLASGSAGNGYLFEARHSALLVECGVKPEVMMRRTAIPISMIAGALVTHEHKDHAGFADRYAALGIPIYASMGTLDAIGRIKGTVRPVQAMRTFHVGEFVVNACALYLDHILVEANYDDYILDGNVANGLVDSAMASRTKGTHMSLKAACELIRADQTAELKNVILIHLSRHNADREEFARRAAETALFARISIAKAGLSIDLNKFEI